MRDRVALVLTGAAIVAGTVGGFCISAAAGFYSLCVLLFITGLLLGLQKDTTPPEPGEHE